MAPYPRLFLHFAYALAVARTGVEVVCFGTRLTRITRLLRSRQPARALERAAMSVLDWNGGTRIADAVSGLRAMRGVRGTLRGATALSCSDGLEQGDPVNLGHQMYLLSRACGEVIWVNPLAGDERYQPIAGGMQMALPWVNRLMPGHTLAALEDVAAALGNEPPPRPGRASGPASSALSSRLGVIETRRNLPLRIKGRDFAGHPPIRPPTQPNGETRDRSHRAGPSRLP